MKKLLLLCIFGVAIPQKACAINYTEMAHTGLDICTEVLLFIASGQDFYKAISNNPSGNPNPDLKKELAITIAIGTYAACKLSMKAYEYFHGKKRTPHNTHDMNYLTKAHKGFDACVEAGLATFSGYILHKQVISYLNGERYPNIHRPKLQIPIVTAIGVSSAIKLAMKAYEIFSGKIVEESKCWSQRNILPSSSSHDKVEI